MKQSIVIPTAGSAEYLTQTLGSLLPMLLEDRLADVVVVENGPQSGTEATVGHFRQAIDRDLARRVRYVHEQVPGLLAGRHRGVLETDGDIISFFDDDVIVSRHHHLALLAAFSDGFVELVGGPSRPIFLEVPPDWFMTLAEQNDKSCFMMTFMSLIDLREGHIRDVNPKFIWGQNFHIRRETFFELRGFHPDGMPQELARFRGDGETGLTSKFVAAGKRADYLDDAAIRHVIPADRMTLAYVRRRAWAEGVSNSYTQLRRNGDCVAPKNCQPRGQKWQRRLVEMVNPAASVTETVRRGRSEGSAFLMHAFETDSQVRNWILKSDYLDLGCPMTQCDPLYAR